MRSARSVEHVVVYRTEGFYCGWPFNGGMWQFADGEIAVGFVRGRCDYLTPQSVGHQAIDNAQGEHLLIRSRDGGRSWPEETISLVYRRPEFDDRARAAEGSSTVRASPLPSPSRP